MEMTKNEDQVVATGSDHEDTNYNSSTSHAHDGGDKVAEFSSGGTPSETFVSLPHLDTDTTGPHHFQTTSASPRPGADDKPNGAVILADAGEPEDPPWKSSGGSATSSSSSSSSTQAPKAQGRRLTFADETGGTLAEVSYSNRTHYSKQTGPSALGGTDRACCAIS